MVGSKLRQARQDHDLSLQAVAKQANISAATLSRIENGKQGLEFGLFVRLAKILERNPGDLVDEDALPEGDQVDTLVTRLATLPPADRKVLWTRFAEARRERGDGVQKRRNQIDDEVEELLAQLEVFRVAILDMKKRLR
jgi:transcriptional regulator with XRE-family HTH domain